MLRYLLPTLLLLSVCGSAAAQSTGTPPPLTPPPTTGQTGELQGKPTQTTDPSQTVTLDTQQVKLRVEPKAQPALSRPPRKAPKPSSRQ